MLIATSGLDLGKLTTAAACGQPTSSLEERPLIVQAWTVLSTSWAQHRNFSQCAKPCNAYQGPMLSIHFPLRAPVFICASDLQRDPCLSVQSTPKQPEFCGIRLRAFSSPLRLEVILQSTCQRTGLMLYT